jgi:hypothetical protein
MLGTSSSRNAHVRLRFLIRTRQLDEELISLAAPILLGADLLAGLGSTVTQTGAAVEG